MRRPTPLPTPAEPRTPPRPEEGAAPLEASGSETARADGAPAPVIAFDTTPFRRPAPGEEGDAADAAPGTAPGAASTASAAPEVDGEALGLRDVWRAARARRRALRAEVRRFTVRQRRRRMLWLGVLVAVVVLVAGTVGAAYSPLFAVQRIEVVGTEQLDPAALEAALSDQVGAPLALVDASAVRAALVPFPLVESYTLEARPPNDLVVRIVERTPVGVQQGSAGFSVVDAAGVVLSTAPEPPAGLPLLDVTGGLTSSAFRAAGQVMRSLPDALRPQVTGLSATTPDDVTLTLGATDTRIVWGSVDDSALKARALEAAMAQRPPDQVRLYDVSSPEAVVVG
jgi:cell division protein FtsQ